MHLLKFIFKDWLGTFLLPSLVLIPLGWLVVPIAMNWRYEDAPKSGHPIAQEHWKYIRLPKWAWIWETNSGLMGDGSYIKTYIWHPTTWLGQYWWTAFRNPMRGWKYKVAGIDLDGFQKIQYWGAKEVDDVAGKFGWHFVVTTVGNRTVTGFYWVLNLGVWQTYHFKTWHKIPYGFYKGERVGKCFRLRAGFKVKPTYTGITRRVGGTPLSISLKDYNLS